MFFILFPYLFLLHFEEGFGGLGTGREVLF